MSEMTSEEAFKLGLEANSVFDNPFLCKDEMSEQATFARFWIDGYVEKLKKESHASR